MKYVLTESHKRLLVNELNSINHDINNYIELVIREHILIKKGRLKDKIDSARGKSATSNRKTWYEIQQSNKIKYSHLFQGKNLSLLRLEMLKQEKIKYNSTLSRGIEET